MVMENVILITGGAGFIGANFINYYAQKYPDHMIVNADKLTYAAELNNIDVKTNYQFMHVDLADNNQVNKLFNNYQFTSVFHFAAESHVDNSISGPEAFLKSNVNGTFYLLQACYEQWMQAPNQAKDGKVNNRFHHISTDEVYGSLIGDGAFTETTAYAPNSPYSATKAGSDFLVRSYFHTYGLNTVTTNCSNNFGPFQHDEKLIPVIIRKALNGEEIPIYGNGKNIRDWLFVKDHCEAIEQVFLKGKSGETYNVGGNNEIENIKLCQMICGHLDQIRPNENGKNYSDQIKFVEDRPGHDFRYAINISKIKSDIGWEPKTQFQTALNDTINWYLQKYGK